MFTKFVRSSLMSLGVVSAISLGAVGLDVAPANAQIVDGDLTEYGDTTPFIGYGSAGAEVKDVQTFLREQGYYNAAVDGIYGRRTRAAITEFQEDNGLMSDGIIGENTWGTLTSFGENEGEYEVERDQDLLGDDDIEVEQD